MFDDDYTQELIKKIKSFQNEEHLINALTNAVLNGYTFPEKINGTIKYLKLDYDENHDDDTIVLIKKRIKDHLPIIREMQSNENFDESEWGEDFVLFMAKQLKIPLYEGKIVKLQSVIEGRQTSLYAFPSKETARQFEIKWEKKVVSKFFKVGSPLTEGKISQVIYTHVKNYISSDKKAPFVIDGLSRRSFIIALTKILSEKGAMPRLSFQLGYTIIDLLPSEENSRRRQKGNFLMGIRDIYDIAYGEGCIKRITYLCAAKWDDSANKNRRKKELLRHMSGRLQNFDSFTYKQFNKYGNICLHEEDFSNPRDPKFKSIQENINFLNGLIFLVTVVEVLVRLYRQPDGAMFNYEEPEARESDSFPVALAQTRSLFLLISGKIKFSDFLGESEIDGYDKTQHRAYFGAVTGIGTIDHIGIMYEKLYSINGLFNSTVVDNDGDTEFFSTYKASNADGQIVRGRSKMYRELKYTYGSGNESDQETSDYSDSEDPELDGVISYRKT